MLGRRFLITGSRSCEKHETEKPVWTLGELLQWFKQADHLPSGQAVALTALACPGNQPGRALLAPLPEPVVSASR